MTAPTLTEFLLARIAEDRILANHSHREPWRVGHKSSCDSWGDMPGYCTCDATARALAECEAKRRIVKAHPSSEFHEWCATCLDPDGRDRGPAHWMQQDAECETLCALATAYADHPDYDEAWRP